ncbi:MAG: glycosyltransferase family 4 protein [Solirubrobacteraceae bacterium]
MLRIFFASAASLLTDHLPSGEGLIAWELLSRLADRGHAVTACADAADLHRAPSFELVLLPNAQRWESLSPYTRPYAIRRAFERRGGSSAYDVVHWLFPQSEDVQFPPTTAACRTVLGPLPRPWGKSDRAFGWRAGDLIRAPLTPSLSRRYARECSATDVLLASLPEVVSTLPRPDAARARVLGFGIDASMYAVTPLPSIPRITFLGRLIENKRVRVLYEAFRTVVQHVEGVELVFVGDGDLRPWLAQRSREDGLGGRVLLAGAVPHDRVGKVLEEASILCLPSAGEPFGMVVLEAMAAGRPVVAVNLGGPRHLVRHGAGGLLVAPDDPAALAAALIELLSDPERMRAMGQYNRRATEHEWSWDRVLDGLEDAYRSRSTGPARSAARTPG